MVVKTVTPSVPLIREDIKLLTPYRGTEGVTSFLFNYSVIPPCI
jgi:hypothetical protein